MNIQEALQYATNKFKLANIESANIDTRLLLSHSLNKSIEYLLLHSSDSLSPLELENFLKLMSERCALKPIAYILGCKEFYGREFELNDKILIPRPDTEVLIEAVLSHRRADGLKILELGVGSGCIIISLLLEIPGVYGFGCDISDDAITITQRNAKNYGVDERLKLIKSDWFENIKDQKFNIIVSNPPYVSLDDQDIMARETLLYEPNNALFANDQGLEAYKIIADRAYNFLEKKGELFVEIGFNQATQVIEIFTSYNYVLKDIFKDLTGHNRTLHFRICD